MPSPGARLPPDRHGEGRVGRTEGVGVTRVALVSSSFHPHVGGVEGHVREVARSLRAQGHEVVVWTVDRGERLGTGLVDGIPVRWLPTPLPAGRPSALARFVREAGPAWRAWSAAWATDRPEVLHVHCFGPNGVYAVLLHHRRDVPLVVSGHGETLMDPEVFADSAQLRFGLRRALREASAVTACSPVALADLGARFGLRGGSVVPNGIRLDPAVPVHAAYRGFEVGGGTVPSVVAVGRLERVKGFDLLLEAFARVVGRLPEARLRIGGTGTQERALADAAAAAGIADAVTFLGRLSAEQVAAEFAAADVVVVPSRREAFGLVVLEAWRSGTPLVATDRDGPADLVADGRTGLLVNPEDPDALAEAVVGLLTDAATAERLGREGQAAAAGYGWDAVTRAYAECYRRATDGPG